MSDRIRSDQNPNIYAPGELVSNNGRAALAVQEDGNFVVYARLGGYPGGSGISIWPSHTSDHPDCHLCMNENGEVCMFKNGEGGNATFRKRVLEQRDDVWIDPLRTNQFKYVPGCRKLVVIRKEGGARNGPANYDGQKSFDC